ncbi:MAG TPA: hypothetical protein VGO08_23295, partial [Burkholderiales bacterium]|nr:hypothetical protein [Burkholderiales bacterium]
KNITCVDASAASSSVAVRCGINVMSGGTSIAGKAFYGENLSGIRAPAAPSAVSTELRGR